MFKKRKHEYGSSSETIDIIFKEIGRLRSDVMQLKHDVSRISSNEKHNVKLMDAIKDYLKIKFVNETIEKKVTLDTGNFIAKKKSKK